MAAQELPVGVSAGQKSLCQMIQAEARGVGGGKPDSVGVELTILFAGEVGRVFGTEFAQFRGEELRLGRRLEIVPFDQVLRCLLYTSPSPRD